MPTLEDAYEAEDEDEDKVESLNSSASRWPPNCKPCTTPCRSMRPDVRAVAGAIVTIDRDGEAAIHRGLLREAEAKALRTLEKLRQGFTGTEGANDDEGEDAEPPKAANLSDRLAQRLSAHRTAALQIEVARHPQVALAALVHRMVQRVLQDGYAVGDCPSASACARRTGWTPTPPTGRNRPPPIALREAATGMGRAAAGGQRRTVRRAAGDGAGANWCDCWPCAWLPAWTW